MPELPEVDALVGFLRERAVGHAVTSATVAAISALKTFDPPLNGLVGQTIDGAFRYGKFVDLRVGELHLVFHLARAGWLRWYDEVPKTLIRPGKSPIALRVRLDDGSGFDLTEAGTKKSLAVHVVRDPAEVPGIARLGPDPTAPEFSLDDFAAILAGKRTRIKGLLRDQSVFAGVGNAYSDEILHNARMSPYALAATLKPEEVERLYHALRDTLDDAIAAASGRPPDELKDSKRTRMQVHGRTGEACPVCGDTVREVIFADSTFQYCPTCQTGGKPLADRVLSRLLK
ncbi:Fpg/Nei family DNA glycosylase [Agromyces sp. ISL-38]|uniref:Fpg/Nei family DNA glycosylase n=1 Tax=Agromyces sp. ISL-38 TaxID=2819107 RepID=UPI001BEC5762|nr:DNA-formamidopyrimidine glycosylase family protein [Agromyces sp. ISL-38]MBT2498865.1 Fpg/Nei family DNA glycosylase [Agromyces sp. ISL-38]MBT2516450.1 Fpg/Nei family DNA glycosylase [Streptomyces sp. ISL-90]